MTGRLDERPLDDFRTMLEPGFTVARLALALGKLLDHFFVECFDNRIDSIPFLLKSLLDKACDFLFVLAESESHT